MPLTLLENATLAIGDEAEAASSLKTLLLIINMT